VVRDLKKFYSILWHSLLVAVSNNIYFEGDMLKFCCHRKVLYALKGEKKEENLFIFPPFFCEVVRLQ
jgi:hypothetical protein